MAFSPDGTQILTGSSDGTARLWPSGINTPRVKEKVLIVAGGGAYPGNDIAEQTKALARRAHVTSTIRGVKPENIHYLSAFETPDQNPLVSGPATRAALAEALTGFAGDARHLTIFLLDHGQYDRAQNEWFFFLDETRTPPERLGATEFDQLLDAAQTAGIVDLTVVVDMCFAGGFVRRCAGVPAGSPVGARRVVIGSTADDRLANYGGGSTGRLSFTGFFLQALLQGVTVQEAFNRARTAIESLQQPREAPQSPWMDDDSDGVYTLELDGTKAARLTLGPASPFGRQSAEEIQFGLAPELLTIAADARVPAPQPLALTATVSERALDGVEAIVTWSGRQFEEGRPIANVGSVELTRVGSTTTWSGTVPLALIPGDGVYTITYVAYRNDLLLPDIRYTSNVKSQVVQVGEIEPDIYEDAPYNDSSSDTTANLLAVSEPQDHNIHLPDDEDWGIVYVDPNAILELQLSDFVVPAGTILSLSVYTEGLDAEPVTTTSAEAISGRVAIPLPGEEGFVYFVVRACDVNSAVGECLPLTSLTVAPTYRVTLSRVDAGRTALAKQVGPARMSVPIALDGYTAPQRSQLRGFRVYRRQMPSGAEVMVPGTGDLSVVYTGTDCDCPTARYGGGSVLDCLEVLDDLPAAPLGPALFATLAYRVEAVYTTGATANDPTNETSGAFVRNSTRLDTVFCPIVVTPSPTPSPSISPSPSPSISPTPTPTASISPSPSISPTPSPTVSPTVSPSISPTVSISPSISPSVSPTVSVSPTASPSISPTPSVSPTPSPDGMTATVSPTPSISPTVSISPSVSPSPTPSVSPSISPTPSVTPTAVVPDVAAALLGRGAAPAGADRNGDGVLDAADLRP